MNLGPSELLLVSVFLVFPVIWIWGIVDADGEPDDAWSQIDPRRVNWFVVMVLLGGVGSAVYRLAIRPQLRRARGRR